MMATENNRKPRRVYNDAFPNGETYMRVTKDLYAERARDKRWNAGQRVEWAALANANASGHAQFGQGELASIIGVSENNVSHAIRKAAGYGIVFDHSTSRCLVIDIGKANTNLGALSDCPFHRTPIRQ